MDDKQQLSFESGEVKELSIVKEMEESYLQYSMSVIVARALPDVRDGLKPVHRRILHVMNETGLKPTAKYRKSATVVGEVMGSYHPHGDQAIYDSMVRMAQEFSSRYTLVDGQGNFGSMDGDPAAAYRYTEARMTKIADELLVDLDKDTVDWRPNFDGSKNEPSVLPAKVPNLLLNGQLGIAVGMATNIPPHNIGEVVDATVEIIDNPEATIDDLMKHIKGPDFPTGGIVYGTESLKTAYATGKGGVVVRAVAEIDDSDVKKGRQRIIVTEIPYGLNKASLIEKIADLVKDKKINGIADLRDESSKGKVRIVIDLKKDTYPKKILNQLYKMTQLQSSFHYNVLALVDGIQPRVLSLNDILKEFLKHRQIVIRRRTEFELRKAKARAHILEGLTKALDHIDEVIATIRASKTQEEAQTNLIKKFELSEIQAKAILAMQLRTLAGLERQKLEDELNALKKLIGELESILADEKKILKIIRDELLDVKERFNDPRRTKIINRELGAMSDEDLIPDEPVVVIMSRGNYIKRTSVNDYRQQNRGGKGKRGMTTKEEDIIQHMISASTHDWLLFFTNKGRVFKLKAYEVPQAGLNAKGIAIVNLLQLQPEEQVTSVIKEEPGMKDGYLFMATKNGTVKKTPLDQYNNVRSSGLITINLDDDDELKWIRFTDGTKEIVISTQMGQAIRFNESDVRPMGRNARGVRGIKLRPGDMVVAMDVVTEDTNIFVISELGYGKRTKVSHFTAHKRGGVGIRSAVVNNKTGKLVGVRSLTDESNEIIIISAQGQTIRLGLTDIPELGRATQGVRIMRLNSGDSVAAVALVLEPEKEAEKEAEKGENVNLLEAEEKGGAKEKTKEG